MDVNDFVSQLNSVINQKNDTENKSIIMSNEIVPQSTKSLKILIVSTHINQVNGYSKVMYNIIKQLAEHPWINVTLFGTQRITNGDLCRKLPEQVKVIDGSALEKQKGMGFAFSELPSVIQNEKPDIVFIYNDISVVCGYVEEIKKAIPSRFFKIWTYLDLTYNSPPVNMIDIINRDIERVFCFTKTWKDELKQHGITRPVDVMNHGIDTKIFRTIPRDLARQSLGLPKDMFLFTSLNKNIPRKRLDLLIMAFTRLIVKYPMKPLFLLIIADKGDRGGYQLFDIFARELKLLGATTEAYGNRLLITSKDTCYKDEDINIVYNCGDVGISCAEGEGFGLCSFEQMGVGVPQIVPNINGYSEYCTENNSIIINPKTRYYIPQAHNVVTGEALIVDVDDVVSAMEIYIFDEDLRKLHGGRAKEKVSEYSWNKCCSILIKRLKTQLEDDE